MMYDLIILGGGPAGYSAAIYAARYNLKTVVIAKEPGGVMNEAFKVENYPGFWNISGFDLMTKIKEHVEYLGVEIKNEEIVSVSKGFKVKTDSEEYEGKTILICTGAKRKRLNVRGEKELEKRGLSYCYTCDGAFYRKKKVIVVGGGDASAQAVILLAGYENEVTWLYRSSIRAEPRYVEQINKMKNVRKAMGEIREVIGKNRVESVLLDNGKNVEVNGVFVEIGSEPDLKLFKNFKLEVDKGYIKVDRNMRTNIDGVYAAGDITDCVFRQAITAAGDGSIAAYSAYKDLSR